MLTAYDPFASAAFRALDQLTGRSGTTTARALSGMPMDAYRVGDNFVAHFDLPGVDPGSIDLSIEGTTLTVSAERSVPQLENAEWAIAWLSPACGRSDAPIRGLSGCAFSSRRRAWKKSIAAPDSSSLRSTSTGSRMRPPLRSSA